MTKTKNRGARRAALLCCAALALLCACGQAHGEPAKTPPASAPDAAKADGRELARMLEERYDKNGGGFSLFEVQRAEVVEREHWGDCPLLDQPPAAGEVTWRERLEGDAALRLFTADLRVKYTPEQAIEGPQYSDGIWTVWGLLEPTDGGYGIVESDIAGIGEDTAPAAPEAAALGLTDDQWIMVGHQVAALAACGAWRDYDSPAEWTEEEFTLWLTLRAKDWPCSGGSTLSVGQAERMIQADFSPENGAWGGMNMRLRESGLFTEGRVELPEAEGPARALEDLARVEYRRQTPRGDVNPSNTPMPVTDGATADELVATVTIPGDGGEVRMEYHFGLVPEDTGPVSRTWLRAARLLEEKAP